MNQFQKGYLQGQLDSAENELEILLELKESLREQWRETDLLIVRIKDTENFLRKHKRF